MPSWAIYGNEKRRGIYLPPAGENVLTFTFASSQYLIHTAGVVTDEPFTMACWFQATGTTTTRSLMALGINGAAGRHVLFANSDATVILSSVGSVGATAVAAGNYTANTWHHAACVSASQTSRIAYLDGNAGTEDTTDCGALATLDRALIGARINVTPGVFHDGKSAEAAIWSSVLSAPNIASLAGGAAPDTIGTPVAYWKLDGDGITEADSVGSFTMDGTGHAPSSAIGDRPF
jgi:hypothetical protein